MSVETFWLIIGFTGQGIFASRFIIQWIVSEREKMSVIPMVFWYISLAGSLTLLSYAIYKQDPVFILGQSTGFIIYLRNIILIKKNLSAQKLPDGK